MIYNVDGAIGACDTGYPFGCFTLGKNNVILLCFYLLVIYFHPGCKTSPFLSLIMIDHEKVFEHDFFKVYSMKRDMCWLHFVRKKKIEWQFPEICKGRDIETKNNYGD